MNFKTKQQIRIDIISQYLNGELRSEDACCALEIGERQFRRLVKGFREQGVASLIHGNKGRIHQVLREENLDPRIRNKLENADKSADKIASIVKAVD